MHTPMSTSAIKLITFAVQLSTECFFFLYCRSYDTPDCADKLMTAR